MTEQQDKQKASRRVDDLIRATAKKGTSREEIRRRILGIPDPTDDADDNATPPAA